MTRKACIAIAMIIIAAMTIVPFTGCNIRIVPEESTTDISEPGSIFSSIPGEIATELESESEKIPAEELEETTTDIVISEDEEDPEPEEYHDEVEEGYADNVAYYNGTDNYAGYFRLTAYEWTGEPMANGEYPFYGACACNLYPLGTVLYIEGHGTFVVCDRGGMSGNWIDIYLGDAGACDNFGVQYADVYFG